MGRPPQGGGPAFRFTQNEVSEMETCLQEGNNAMPSREVISAFAEKFSSSAERLGKIPVQPKQVWNWFQNRRHAHRAKAYTNKASSKASQFHHEESSISFRTTAPVSGPSATVSNGQMEFEAKSARDGAWYDVSAFLSHRLFETGDPEVRVRFSGFGMEEDEWVNVRKCVRQRSLPCESAECVAVLPNDLILCFQEGKEQALYFDAHVLDAQRRRHDVRGCRCRFLVRYDHDQSEEIVPLRKVCRRPETDYRLQILQASRLARAADHHLQSNGPHISVMDPPIHAPLHKMTTARNNTEDVKITPEKKSNSVMTLDGASEDAAGGVSCQNTVIDLSNQG